MKKIKYILSAFIVALIGIFCISKFNNKKVSADISEDFILTPISSGTNNSANSYSYLSDNALDDTLYYLKINLIEHSSQSTLFNITRARNSTVNYRCYTFRLKSSDIGNDILLFFSIHTTHLNDNDLNNDLYLSIGASGTISFEYEFGSVATYNITPIYDSFGNVIINDTLYYSNANYLNYGSSQREIGYYEGYQEGIENYSQLENLFVDGSFSNTSCFGYKNGVETRLTSQQYDLYYTEGGLLLTLNLLDFDRVKLTFAFNSNSKVARVGISQGGSSFYASPLNISLDTYNGSYWYHDLADAAVLDGMEFQIPKSTNGFMSNEIRIYALGYTDLNYLILQAFNNGVASQQPTINELREQVENGFSLFTPVTALLNTPLFYIGNKPFTLGIILMFSLGLTAVFIFIKIFK